MVVHTGTWHLIQENSEDNYESLKCWEAHFKHTHSVEHYSFTMRKSKRFHFLSDLELQWNLSSIYYNPLAAIRTTEEYKYLMPEPTLTGHVYRWKSTFFRSKSSFVKWNKNLKPDWDTNLNNPSAEVDCPDCNLRLV